MVSLGDKAAPGGNWPGSCLFGLPRASVKNCVDNGKFHYFVVQGRGGGELDGKKLNI